jgi:hypothetical protein
MDRKRQPSLSDRELVTERPIGRRSGIAAIGAALAGAAGWVIAAPELAEAQCTDRDRGRRADPAGRGRSCCRGISDSDPRDPAGCGRRACSDRDPYDPAGRGRRC